MWELYVHVHIWLAVMTQTGWFLFFLCRSKWIYWHIYNAVSAFCWQVTVKLTAKSSLRVMYFVITTKDVGLVLFRHNAILANCARQKEAISSWSTEGKKRLSWPLNNTWKLHILVSFSLCPVLTLVRSTGWDQKWNVRKNPNETSLTNISHKSNSTSETKWVKLFFGAIAFILVFSIMFHSFSISIVLTYRKKLFQSGCDLKVHFYSTIFHVFFPFYVKPPTNRKESCMKSKKRRKLNTLYDSMSISPLWYCLSRRRYFFSAVVFRGTVTGDRTPDHWLSKAASQLTFLLFPSQVGGVCRLSTESSLRRCRTPDGKICSGKGKCECGVCFCTATDPGKFYGPHCECQDWVCATFNGKTCNGAFTGILVTTKYSLRCLHNQIFGHKTGELCL